MITVVTYAWGTKYSPDYVDRVAAGVKRHLKQPHRFVVITDDFARCSLVHACWEIPQEDRYLLEIPGCFTRLRLFDLDYLRRHLVEPDERVVCLDLDMIITGPLDPLFDRPEPFVILQGANSSNPCPYNGSLWFLRAGAHQEVWSEFTTAAAAAIPYFVFPDDQAWFHHMIPNAAGWRCGAESGVFAYQKPGWPRGEALPPSARIVAFPGKRDPSQFTRLPWVRKHWIET